MNELLIQFAMFAGFVGVVLGGLGLFAGHQWRKYADIAQAERDAAHRAAP